MQIIQQRKWYYIISALIIIPGIISLMMQGLNLGIDFSGGSMLHIKLPGGTTSAQVSKVLGDMKIGKADIQKSGDEFYIRTAALSQEKTDEVMEGFKTEFKEVKFLSSENVGAVIGKELTRNAILALLIATVMMLLYITFRFEWTFGIAAIVGIIHNVLVVLGLFSLFQWEINSAFIAAILTIIGYTINDTIIIFDRVRENLRIKSKEDFSSLLNRSIMQMLNRSLNTVLTSVFALIALIIFGGESIKLFVLAMLIGFTIGAYSSIFITSPVLYEIRGSKA
ncbi:MAG: protein translocase subunit SecF [Syntrophomonadaceae bacterium]|jgi:preprotein translocase subunit SecF